MGLGRIRVTIEVEPGKVETVEWSPSNEQLLMASIFLKQMLGPATKVRE